MKTNTRHTAARLALAAFTALAPLTLALPITASAQEHADHDKATVPDTVPAIWTEISKHQGELTAVVAARKLAEVHHHAYAIRDLVAALPAKAAADKKARVDGAAKNMAALAEKLDAAGGEPTKDTERSGPELGFHLLPEKTGFEKFYVQVQLGGKDVYAGFGLDVAAAPKPLAGN